MRIFTSRYQNKQLADFPALKVGISIGAPRFKIAYPVIRLKELMPRYPMMKLHGDEFKLVYLAYLQSLTAARVIALLEQTSRANGDADLVLLCFEDVNAGQLCHRRYLAEFLVHHLGIEIPELPTNAEASLQQASMFYA